MFVIILLNGFTDFYDSFVYLRPKGSSGWFLVYLDTVGGAVVEI